MRDPSERLRALRARLGTLPRWARWSAAAVVVLTLGLVLVLGLRAFSVSCDPDVPCVSLAELKDGASLPEAMHVFDRFGEPLADVAGPRRHAIPQERIPERLEQAWVAVEDRRFWEHEGVDVRGILRAAWQDVRSGNLQEGASTIPMQLVRTLWAESLAGVTPWRRKIIEARTAPELIDELGHERVLALYLNSIYMGNGLYGVGAASRYYFGVPPDSLDLAQTATLVGMTRAPERYEPRRHTERARARRDVVLGVLARAGVISQATADSARATDLVTLDVPPDLYRRDYITAAVTRALADQAPDLVRQPGLYVFTTIDPRIQEAGRAALRAQLEAIEKGRYGKVDTAGAGPLQGSAVALDVKSGAVRAWVGGRDFGGSQFDRVAQSRRQVGSLVKPFIVASALEAGYGILDAVSSDTLTIRTAEGLWSPDDHVDTPILPMREALVHSSNRAAVHLGRTVGFERVRHMAGQVGLDAQIPDVPSAFIGSFEATLLDVTGAFASFGNGGFRIEPYLVERIEDAHHRVLWEHLGPDRLEHALDEVTAFVVLDALRDVVDRGTGWPVRQAGFRGAAAGKTGTTNGSRDAWFVGLVPDLASGVWIGFDRPRTIVRNGSGGTLAGPVWGSWMKAVADSLDAPRGAWVPPLGVRRVRYDENTGMPVPDTCHPDDTSGYATAYIPIGDYTVDRCPGGFGDWLKGIWKALKPGDVKPVNPLTKRNRSAAGDTIRGDGGG